MHVGKSKVSAMVYVTIKKASNISAYSLSDNRNTVFIKWERTSSGMSSKKKEGATKRALINNNEAFWEETLSIKCTFYQNTKTQKWDPKHLYFTLKEDQVTAKGKGKADTGTKEKALGKWKIDLSDYVNSDGAEPVIFPMTAKKKGSSKKSGSSLPMSLTLVFKCQWIKFNNKKLIKVDDSDPDPYKREVMQIEGEEYYLETTTTSDDEDDATTETEAVDVDDDVEDQEEFMDDNNYQTPPPVTNSKSKSGSGKGTIKGAPAVPALPPKNQPSSNNNVAEKPPPLPPKDNSSKNVNVPPLPPKESNKGTVGPSSKDTNSSSKTNGKTSVKDVDYGHPAGSNTATNPASGSGGTIGKGSKITSPQLGGALQFTQPSLANPPADLVERCSFYEKQLQIKDDRIRQLETAVSALQAQIVKIENPPPDAINVSQAKMLKQQYDQLLKDQKIKADIIARQERELENFKKQVAIQSQALQSVPAVNADVAQKPTGSNSNSNLTNGSFITKFDSALAQDMEELNLVESAIYTKEPTFTGKHGASAVAIYDSLVSFRAFDPTNPRTRFLNHIIKAINQVCKRSENDEVLLAYWLNCVSSLLYFISKANFPSSSQLSEFTTSLQSCLPTIFSFLLVIASNYLSVRSIAAILEQQPSLIGTKKQSMPSRYSIHSIIDYLEYMFCILEKNNVPRTLVDQFFEYAFYGINTTVFNALIKRKNFCTCGHGFQIKLEVSVLEEWISNRSLQVVSSQLEHIIEAANLLVMDKSSIGDWTFLHKAFPVLTSHQILLVLTTFTPDDLNKTPTPPEIIEALRRDVEATPDDDSLQLWFYPEGPLKLDLTSLLNSFAE